MRNSVREDLVLIVWFVAIVEQDGPGPLRKFAHTYDRTRVDELSIVRVVLPRM